MRESKEILKWSVSKNPKLRKSRKLTFRKDEVLKYSKEEKLAPNQRKRIRVGK